MLGSYVSRHTPLLAALLAVFALVLAWGPFLSRMDVVVRHFDGPNYLVVAKAFYVPSAANPLPGYALSPSYFAMHTPLYPRGCSCTARSGRAKRSCRSSSSSRFSHGAGAAWTGRSSRRLSRPSRAR